MEKDYNEAINIPDRVEATLYFKEKYYPKEIIGLITFIDNGHLYCINNIGNKQMMLGKDRALEFDKLIETLILSDNLAGFKKVELNVSNYKEDITQESIRISNLKDSAESITKSRIKFKP